MEEQEQTQDDYIEKLKRNFRSSADKSSPEIEEALRKMSDELDNLGVPHFLVAGYLHDEKALNNHLKCKGAGEAMIEIFVNACVSSPIYTQFFIGLGKILEDAMDQGLLARLNKGANTTHYKDTDPKLEI